MTLIPTQFDKKMAVPRRTMLVRGIGLLTGLFAPRWSFSQVSSPQRRWYEAADAMKRLAVSWGDQPYGAVLVMGVVIVGDGPSRVVKNRDPDAHAEREAIKDAQRRLNRTTLDGSILYSTSRACALCEAAAADAGVSRMYFGADMRDAGAPRR
jgi:tRNA(Arg) A34 adenosine deaminase TadA